MKPRKGYKFVKVNNKITIEVPIDKSDEEAIKGYNDKLKNYGKNR